VNNQTPLIAKSQFVPVAFSAKDFGADATENLPPTLRAGGFDKSHANSGNWMAIQQAMSVRRLTPIECERLQGFPDNYTLVPHRCKPAADGPRYKALGNSMAVPVMRWIGERIDMVEQVGELGAAA
jgi:DNA (cytosine-5)-methyltransferase 1